MIKSSHPIILASGSRARKQVLQGVGVEFSVQTSPTDEEALKEKISSLEISEQALFLAKAKGEPVAKDNPTSIVISADQICECDGEIFSKPGNKENAIEQLQKLQGKTHTQHSAVAVFLDGECVWSKVEQAKLTMRELSQDEITAYVELDQPFKACGSFHYEEHGKHLFAHVEGSDDVIFGLALQPLLHFLHGRGYISL